MKDKKQHKKLNYKNFFPDSKIIDKATSYIDKDGGVAKTRYTHKTGINDIVALSSMRSPDDEIEHIDNLILDIPKSHPLDKDDKERKRRKYNNKIKRCKCK